MRYSDAGEPSGTGGQPMLGVLRREELTDVCVVATRYFGGILLGAGGLTRAYAKAAKEFIINTMRGEEPSDFSIALVPSIARVQSKTSALIKGFLLGSVLAAGLLTLLFVLDDRPRTPEDINMYGGIPTLAVLPSTKEMKKLKLRLRQKKSRRRKTGRWA